MKPSFDYLPTPAVLQGLSAGQLTSRWQRSLRLWWILRSLYGQSDWQSTLSQPFRYADLRETLFAPSHNITERASPERLSVGCQGSRCLCQRSLDSLLEEADPSLAWDVWIAEMSQLTGLPDSRWHTARKEKPFAVGHRSIRDDLKALVEQGWLKHAGRGQFRAVAAADWPILKKSTESTTETDLTTAETWELISALEAIAFVQPNLEVVLARLWESVAASQSGHPWQSAEPQRRIFIHLDYILSPQMQEQVDNHQSTLEQLWRTQAGGMVQFEYGLAHKERVVTVTVTVYPVCMHYVRRAKYLSAYGADPEGKIGWHNYRLDRIVSKQLKVLPWGDAAVPKSVKAMRDSPLVTLHERGELPTPMQVEEALEEAWGFNFYLPKAWLLMRFSPWFARWYVDQTERHPTFKAVPYEGLSDLITKHVPLSEQASVQQIVAQKSPQDIYYAGWVRMGDINVVMRLRDWRPKGEVIAPWGLRLRMVEEVKREAANYEW